MMHPDIIKMCDETIKRTTAQSRNDFIEEAILFYIGYLSNDDNRNYISEALESVIKNNIQLTEDRLAKLLFKVAVELSIMMNVVAINSNVDEFTLQYLRGKCVEDVKQSIGILSFSDTLRGQNL